MQGAEIAEVRQRKLGKVCFACRAELVGRNDVTGERKSGSWIARNRRRARTGRATSNVVKVTAKLCCRRDPRLPHLAAVLFVPLVRVEEEELVLLDRSAYGEAVIVAAQKVLLSANRIADNAVRLLLAEEEVFGIELIVAAEIINVPVKLVSAAFGDEVDLRTARAAVLRAIAVAQDLKFLDGIYRGINQNGALRALIIVVGPVHQPLVGIGWCAAEGDVNPRQQALVLVIEASAHRSARHQRGQLDEVAPVQRQLA